MEECGGEEWLGGGIGEVDKVARDNPRGCDLSREHWLLLESGWGKQVNLLVQKRQGLYGL